MDKETKQYIEETVENASQRREKRNAQKKRDRSVIWEVFVRDLKRIITNPILLIMMIAVLAFPSLYAWCGIGANWDPYSNTSNLPVSVVIEDEPAQSSLVGEVYLGQTLKETLEGNSSLKWDFCSREEAMYNIDVGLSYAAYVVPKDFSQSICNIFEGENVRDYSNFEVYINERSNAAAVKVTDTGATTIEAQINNKFRGVVSGVIAGKITEISQKISGGSKNIAGTLSDRLSMIAQTVYGFNNVLGAGENVGIASDDAIQSIRQTLTDLQAQLNQTSSILDQSRTTLSRVRTNVSDLIKELKEKLPSLETLIEVFEQLQTVLDDASSVIEKTSTIVNDLQGSLIKVLSALDTAQSLLDKTGSLNGTLKETISVVNEQLQSASLKLSAVSESNEESFFSKIFKIDSKSVGEFMAAPVKLVTEVINPVKNYGTGIAPFFSCVTFWVAGFVLIALVKTEVDPPKKRRLSAKQAYISRGLLYSLIAILQGVVCNVGELIMGIGCENPGLFILTGAFASLVFVNIIYMLAACFKHVGKALTVVLIVMQIPGSSGMYPIELMPSIFQTIHPFLPFTYAINAMRETIVNFNVLYWLLCILVLSLMWAIAFFIGVFARRGMANLNLLFDRMLSDTDLISCETKDHVITEPKQSIDQIANVIVNSDEYSEQLGKKINEFERKYKFRSRLAVGAMAIVPPLFLIVLCIVFNFIEFDINAKIIFMLVWLLLLVIFAALIIAIEFMHVRLQRATNDKEKTINVKNFENTVRNEKIDYA